MDYAKKRNDKRFVSIFIAPISLETLKNRLLKRATESKEKIEARIKQAEWELSIKDKYDYVIVNADDPSTASNKLKELLLKKI